MSSAEKFIRDFHSLEGVTLGERKLNFNKLLKLNSSLPEAEITLISKNLNPQTYLESLFKIDVLIAFKRTPELLEILKEGNDVFVSKIVKNPWFIQEAFGKIGAQDLVNSVLPNTSFSARMKILTRLSSCLEEKQIDEIFDCVKERYGLFIASKILHRCSPKKIEEIVTNFTVDFNSSKLKLIYLKDPQLIQIYFTECEKKQKKGDSDNYFDRFQQSFIPFLFQKDPNFCIELCAKFQMYLKVGRRSTKTYLDLKKDQIIEKPEEYQTNVKLSALFRHLSRENTIKFIENYLDSRITRVNYDDCKTEILDGLPKKLRYDLFSKSFEAKFNTTILNNPKLISTTLLESLDTKERIELRNDLARAKLKADATEDDFIKYLPVDESIPLLKEKLRSCSSIKDRRKFLSLMVETCIDKDDMAALTEVIKYFYERHRNDREDIHREIMWKLDEVDKKKFTEELWKLSNNLAKIRLVKFNSGVYISDEMPYLEYLFKENKLTEEDIFKYIKKNCSNDPIYFYDNVSSKNNEFKKYLLHLFLEKGESVIEGDDPLLEFKRRLIEVIDDYNEEHKNEPIVEIESNPKLMKYLMENLEKTGYISSLRNYFKRILLGKIQVKDRDFYIRYFIKKFKAISAYDDELIPWFLKYSPQIVSEELNDFLKLNLNKRCISMLKKYSHLNLDEKIIETTLKTLDENDSSSDQSQDEIGNVKLVTEIMYPVERFVEFANERKPTEPKFDVDTENAVKLYKMRCEIAKGFKHFTGNHKIVLPALLNYCIGDYFGSALGSLRRILCHTPENQVSPIIEQLSQSSVTIRKHALSITCEICDVVSAQTQLEMLKPGQNKVAKRRVMKSIMGFFRKNPSDQVYEIVKPKMALMCAEDCTAAFSSMTNIRRIPKKYQSGYVEFVWNMPKEDDNKNVNELREQLLDNLYEDAIKELPVDFCLKILNENFFKDSSKVRNFVSDLLVYHPEKLKILHTVFELLDEKNEPNRLFAYFFIYYNRIMKEKHLDHEFLETFSKYWDTRINPEQDFDNYIRLQFLKLKSGLGDQVKVADFNDLVRKLLDDLISKYGQCIISPLGEVLKFGVKFFAGETDVDSMKYFEDLLKRHNSVQVAILVMQMLQPLKPNEDDKDKFSAFKSLMEGLQGVPDPGVQIIFKRKYWNCIKDLE